MSVTFSNPRLTAEFDDWPIGGTRRGKCKFYVEADSRGTRVCRQTQDKFGKWCNPRKTTYGGLAVIVDGSNDRTYVLRHAKVQGFIDVISHDFMSPAESELGFYHAVFPGSEHYNALADVIKEGQVGRCHQNERGVSS